MKWCSRLFEKGTGRKKNLIFISAIFFSFLLGGCVSVQDSPLVAAPKSLTGGEKWLFEAHSPVGTIVPSGEIEIYVVDNGQKTKIGSGNLSSLNPSTIINGEYKKKGIQAECREKMDGSYTRDKCTIFIEGEKGPTLHVTTTTMALK